MADNNRSPEPRPLTLVEDFQRVGLRLLEPAWPARLLISTRILDAGLRGGLRDTTYDGTTLRMVVTNGNATYRKIEDGPQTSVFDCVQSARDVRDA